MAQISHRGSAHDGAKLYVARIRWIVDVAIFACPDDPGDARSAFTKLRTDNTALQSFQGYGNLASLAER